MPGIELVTLEAALMVGEVLVLNVSQLQCGPSWGGISGGGGDGGENGGRGQVGTGENSCLRNGVGISPA